MIKKEKNHISGQKNKLGLNLRTKKRSFWAKILIKIEFKGQKFTNSQKKKKNDISGQKNKLGLNFRTKKGLFRPKILIKIEFEGQKLIQKKKKLQFGPKKQAGAELQNKIRTFLGKNCEKN